MTCAGSAALRNATSRTCAPVTIPFGSAIAFATSAGTATVSLAPVAIAPVALVFVASPPVAVFTLAFAV